MIENFAQLVMQSFPTYMAIILLLCNTWSACMVAGGHKELQLNHLAATLQSLWIINQASCPKSMHSFNRKEVVVLWDHAINDRMNTLYSNKSLFVIYSI